jgi:glutamyl endopeptidase
MFKHLKLRLITAAVAGGAVCALSAGAAGAAVAAPADDPLLSLNALVSNTGRILPVQSPHGNAGGGTSGHAGTGAGARGRPAASVPGRPASGPRAIIGGSDGRIQVGDTTGYPNGAVVLMKKHGHSFCTGFLVSPNVLVTAGHCLRGPGLKGAWGHNLTFLAGSDGGNDPFGTCKAEHKYVLRGWYRFGYSQYDMGMVVLDCRVGVKAGYFGFFWHQGNLDGRDAILVGYPGEKHSTMWLSKGHIQVTEPLKLMYNMDTTQGESGSPVFQFHDHAAGFCHGECVMAVHSGTTPQHAKTQLNIGTRITGQRFATLQDLISRFH